MSYSFIKVPDDLVEQQFKEAMYHAGVIPQGGLDHFILNRDGKVHRFDVENGRRGDNDGAYKVYPDDPPAGWFQNHKGAGELVRWCFDYKQLKDSKDYSEAWRQTQTQEFKKAQEQRRKEREAKEKAERAKAIEDARVRFEEFKAAPKNHEYLKRKQISVSGLKIDGGGNLLLPFYDEAGRFQAMQKIPAGAGEKKKTWLGTSLTGAWFTLGGDITEGPLLVSEGIATGASIFQCLDGRYTTIVVGDCGNLSHVCKKLRRKYPGRPIYVMADDDAGPDKNGNPKENAGKEKAFACWREKSADWVCPPDFDRKADGFKDSDWNDYFVRYGEEKTRAALIAAIEYASKTPEERKQDEARQKIREQVVSINAADLMRKEFPPIKWAVEPILPEGCSILAGAPKTGKSYFALEVSLAVAIGGLALNAKDVEQGRVLYLALEDTPRRIQARIKEANLTSYDGLDKLDIVYRIPGQADGGLVYIREWLEGHKDARLIIIDTFQKFRPPRKKNGDLYGEDYQTIASIKALADEFNVAALIIHHLRKSRDAEGDFVNEISGTQGIAGAADTILVMKRGRMAQSAILSLTGRDVEEAEYFLTRDVMGWKLEGDAAECQMSEKKRRVLVYLRTHGPSKPKDVAEYLGEKSSSTKQTLRRMCDDGDICKKDRGLYCVPEGAPLLA